MPTVFITGANRGIGFHMAKLFAQDPANTVIATTRKIENAGELQKLGKNVHVITLDTTAPLEEIEKSVSAITKFTQSLDVVIQNAGTVVEGISTDPKVNHLTRTVKGYEENLQINTLGSIKVYQAVFPYWQKETGHQKKFIYISSAAGLINNFGSFSCYGYGLSKAALNYFVKETSVAHTQSEIDTIKHSVSVAVHPGLVLTDLTEEMITELVEKVNFLRDLYLTVEESTEGIKKLIDGLTEKDTGTFQANGTLENARAGFASVSW